MEGSEFKSENVEISDIKEDESESLEDFFAKKDRSKKGKKKKKYITTEALAKTLEKINTGEEEEPKKEKEGAKSQDGTKGINNNDTEEWHEYEDESNRDYSDLKIQNFQISDQKETEEEEPQYDEEGELIPPKPVDGPWKTVAKEPQPVVEQTKPKHDVPPEQPPATKSVYRPPQARLSSSSATTPGGIQPGMGRRRRPQEAPVINSEIDFPSLSSAAQDTEQHKGFETVKSGSKAGTWNQQQSASQPASLKLGNQFAALRD